MHFNSPTVVFLALTLISNVPTQFLFIHVMSPHLSPLGLILVPPSASVHTSPYLLYHSDPDLKHYWWEEGTIRSQAHLHDLSHWRKKRKTTTVWSWGGEGVDKNQSHHKSVDQRTDPWDWQKILFSWLTFNKFLYANPHQAPVTDQAWYQRGKVNLTVPSSSLGILIGGVEHGAKSSSRIQDVTHPVYPLAQSPTLI